MLTFFFFFLFWKYRTEEKLHFKIVACKVFFPFAKSPYLLKHPTYHPHHVFTVLPSSSDRQTYLHYHPPHTPNKSWLQHLQLEDGFYSGRKLTRFGRSADWSFLMSFVVTLQDSSVSCFKFFSGFRCCRPEPVMREFVKFKDTRPVNPVHLGGE